METILATILAAFGGTTGLIAFGLFLVLAVLAIIATAFMSRGNPGMTDRIVRIASYSVLAVKKLSDNGQYDGLSEDERHAAKKAAALSIIEDGLRAEGVKPNVTLMAFAGFAIETALSSMRSVEAQPTSTPTELSE